MDMDMNTAQQEYIKHGGNPNKKHMQDKLAQAEQEAIENYRQQKAATEAQRSGWAIKARNVAQSVLSVVSVAFIAVVSLFGVLVATTALVIAEYAAVRDGIAVIDSGRASLYALCMVALYLILLFIKEIVAAHTTRQRQQQFSLQHVYRWLKYVVGGDGWTPRYKQPADGLTVLHNTIWYLTWTIALFGVMGRLGDSGYMTGSVWYEAVLSILTQSTLADLLGYVGALVMTLALLGGMHFVVYFVYTTFTSVTGGIDIHDFSDASITSRAAMIEAAKSKVYQTETLLLEQKNSSNT